MRLILASSMVLNMTRVLFSSDDLALISQSTPMKSTTPHQLGDVTLRQLRPLQPRRQRLRQQQQNDTTKSLNVGAAAKWTAASIQNKNCYSLQHTKTSDVFSLQLSVSRVTDPSSWGLRRQGAMSFDIAQCLERNIIILQFCYDTSPRILRSYLDSSISGFFTLVRDTTLYSHRYE